MTSFRAPDFVLLVDENDLRESIPAGNFDAWLHRRRHRHPLHVGCMFGGVRDVPQGMIGLGLWKGNPRGIIPLGQYVTVEYCEEDLEFEPPVSIYASKLDGKRYFFRALIAQSWEEWHEHKT